MSSSSSDKPLVPMPLRAEFSLPPMAAPGSPATGGGSVHEAAAAKAKDARLDAILQRIQGKVGGGTNTGASGNGATGNPPPLSSAAAAPRAAAVLPGGPAGAATANQNRPAPPAPGNPTRSAGETGAPIAPGPGAGLGSRDERRSGRSEFVPLEPASLSEAAMNETELEAILVKFLLAAGDATGRDCAEQIRLPFNMIDAQLRRLKQDQVVVYRATAAANDFVYALTDLGRERARRYSAHCTYFGAAPVPLADYVASVKAQSIERQHPTEQDLKRAFGDLLVNPKMFRRLGPAINSGRGLFLFGAPGNGKTSLAERITGCFGQTLWIPRALNFDGEIMRLYDPAVHEEMPVQSSEGLYNASALDRRWVRIRRPTVVVGGELTMENLEVSLNSSTGICEAPVQLKSNCGTLVIDDFGRQKMRIDELLNRWIIPLEKRYDFLNMPNGKKLMVPFDQLIVFSTNLEPRDLVDEAFLRRIPFKIEVLDPTEEEFRELFKLMCGRMNIEHREGPINYLIRKYYLTANRKFRACHPRDLLAQVKSHCAFYGQPPELTDEHFDIAAENYFAVM